MAKRKLNTTPDKRTSESKPTSSSRPKNKQKGNLVEGIAAMLHDSAGVKVERNVFLPPVTGISERKREIDVLLTSYVAGYPVKIALECKNEAATTGVEYIDAFIGKLDDVGIPHQHGIFISATGYTSGAIDRAKAKGIRTLVLTGLTADRLSAVISEAWQYTVFLLPVVKGVTITNCVAKGTYEMLAFYNERGELCGLLPDLIWFKWQTGEIDSTLGERKIELHIPSGWQQIINGKPEPPLELSAIVEVVGIVLKLTGKAQQHSLIDALANRTDRVRLNVDFNVQRLYGRRVSFRHFFTEKKLKAWIEKRGGIRLITRVQLPRLQYQNQFYYPMSERVAGIVINQLIAHESGQVTTPPVFAFDELEGKELSIAWEPIWKGHYNLWSLATREVAAGQTG